MSDEQRLLLLFLAAVVLVVLGAAAALKLFMDAFARRRPAPTRQEVKMAQPVELLRIMLDPATQQLQLYLSGRPARAEDIADAQVRAQVQSLMRLLQPGAGAPAAAPARPPVTAAPPAAAPAASPEPEDVLRAPFLARLRDGLRPPVYDAPPPVAAPSQSQRPADAPAANMFVEINDILQRMLRQQGYATPLEIIGESGELHIKYGERVYLQVDAVPDERARALIHAAVGEWEAR